MKDNKEIIEVKVLEENGYKDNKKVKKDNFFKKYKKTIKRGIIIGGVLIIVFGGITFGAIYKTVKGNVNYTEEKAKDIALDKVKSEIKYNLEDSKKIALDKVKGEVIKTKEDFDDDNMSLVYEFEIKGNDNMLYEVEVDSKTGAIVDFDSPVSDKGDRD